VHAGSAAGHADAALGPDCQCLLGRRAHRFWIGQHRLWRFEGRTRRSDAQLRPTARVGGRDGQRRGTGLDRHVGKPLIEAGFVTRIPVGRAGSGDEIAQAILMIVSNGYMTGQTIGVNGGVLFS